jgi:hypothetical protein
MKRPNKIRLVGSKQQSKIGLFDEVRIVRIQVKRTVKASNDRG